MNIKLLVPQSTILANATLYNSYKTNLCIFILLACTLYGIFFASTAHCMNEQAASSEIPQKEAPQKEAPQKEAPQKEAPQKEAPQKEAPQKEELYVQHFKDLVNRSATFAKKIAFPTTNNLVKALGVDTATQKTIVRHMETTRPIIHYLIMQLIDDFLAYKKNNGTDIEKSLYASMDKEAFIDRLLQKRPLMFMTSADSYLLRDGKTRGHGGFEAIGTDKQQAPLILEQYLSYDEMQIAALIGMAVPTYFINKGDRNNNGKKGQEGTYEKTGIYIGLVGARFEKPGLMEWQHIVVTQEQNKPELGYGAHPTVQNPMIELWKKCYGLTFPTYQEAKQDATGRYKPFRMEHSQAIYYFDVAAYKKRMQLVVEPFLLEANMRGQHEYQQKVYVQAVGLGLGVWQIESEQGQWLVDVYADIMAKRSLPYIADINFSWFPATITACGGVANGGIYKKNNNAIAIHFSKRDPAEPLVGVDAGKLLIVQYAWDGNTYPGNEYWAGMLTASGDPAAASCSTIPELQNPEINPFVAAKHTHFFGH